jgi:predicted RNA-binding protein with PIN domain
MSLHFLIDGYNLMYALPEIPAGTLEQKREAVLALVLRHALLGKNQMTVVFDSRQGLGDNARKGSVHVVFTAGGTADDWISDRVRAVDNPRTVVVVTNDKGIHQMIHGTGAKAMEIPEFLARGRLVAPKAADCAPPVDREGITEAMKKEWLG